MPKVGDIGYATLNYGLTVGSFIEKVEILSERKEPAAGGAEYEIITVKVVGNSYQCEILIDCFYETYYSAVYGLLYQTANMIENIRRDILNINGKPGFLSLNEIETDDEMVVRNQAIKIADEDYDKLSKEIRKHSLKMKLLGI